MADILLLTLIFRPDNVSTAHLMSDLAADLQGRGHKVTVLTSTPHYNRDPEAERLQPMRDFWLGLVKVSDYEGIRVLHVWMPRKGKQKLYRMLTWVSFHIISTLVGIVSVPRPQIILCPSPPLTIGLSAWFLARFHRARFIYNVQEIYPDVAINLEAVRNQWVINRLYWLEQFVYGKAARMSVISLRMKNKLMQKGVPEGKLALIPNFVDVKDFSPLARDNEFSRKHGFSDKFLVSYAGNMGRPQHLETLVLAAAELRKQTAIHFLFMGEGTETEALRQLAASLRLENVTFLGQQPYSLMPLAYAAIDASYVPQAIGTSADGVPSKVYRIMASARPVIACTDPDSDLANLISDAKCGYVITSHDPVKLGQAIACAAADADAWRLLGANGREHVMEHYERSRVVDRYDSLISEVLGKT
jgi:colanic acid biosynthesis glycosyl transferase WcaI